MRYASRSGLSPRPTTNHSEVSVSDGADLLGPVHAVGSTTPLCPPRRRRRVGGPRPGSRHEGSQNCAIASGPLKDGYRVDPATALDRRPARRPSSSIAVAHRPLCGSRREPGAPGLHPAAGGGGGEACSADLLLEALVACAGVTLAAVATAMSIDIRSVRRSWPTACGTRAAPWESTVGRPVGMTGIAVRVDVDTDADDAIGGAPARADRAVLRDRPDPRGRHRPCRSPASPAT